MTEGLIHTIKILSYLSNPSPQKLLFLRSLPYIAPQHKGEGCSVLSYRIKTHLTITKVRNVSPSCPAHAYAIGEVAGGVKKQGKNIKSTLSQNEKYHF